VPNRVISRVGNFGPPMEEWARNGAPEVLRLERGPDQAALIGARDVYPYSGGGDWVCAGEKHWLFAGTGMKNGDGIPGLAESLLERGRFDPQDIVGRYLRWWREGAFDTGPVSGRALELMASGMSPSEASTQVHREFGGRTAGCNPAHRSPPLAMLAPLADADLAGCAVTEARLTHHDPLAGDVAAAVTALCRCLVRGFAWESAVQRPAEGRQAQTSEALFSGQEGPGTSGGFAPEVLRAAVYFVGSSSSFPEALGRSLAFAGPANYGPVLVGAVGGARWGSAALPRQALAHVDILPRVETSARGLAAGWATG
jgi:ADP-ribosylglycohydrolase